VTKPESSATRSIDASEVSSSRCAASTRWCVSHWWGVVPACASKRRASVRSDIRPFFASDCTVSGWSSRALAHSMSGASEPSTGGIAEATNCDWPPSRCGATTMRRATWLAMSEP
jgi:hypothetical protein